MRRPVTERVRVGVVQPNAVGCRAWSGTAFDTAPVRTCYVRMNITLSVDERIVERARDAARRQGTSLNALIRQYLERIAGERTGEERARAFDRVWKSRQGHSGGRKVRRDDAYDERLR
ncbi:MAG: DUF6364 family protein [Myxococcaceae bacterium]